MRDGRGQSEDGRGNQRKSVIPPIITKSSAMRSFLGRLRRFAQLERPVLLEGERGTGKTTYAELIHTQSPRASGPFVRVNLASLSDGVAITELFGHVKGAYTSAIGTRPGLLRAAAGGTILLDEIGKASLDVQRGLLPVLDRRMIRPVGADREEPIDVRLVFACNEDRERLVHSGAMLADFKDRLGFFHARIPRLRDRVDDLPELTEQFVSQAAAADPRYTEGPPRVTPGLLRRLAAYDWPGNVRELESLCERLVADADGSPILSESLLAEELAIYTEIRVEERPNGRMPTVAEVHAAIRECGGNLTKAALKLGIGRTTLYRILSAKRDYPEERQPPA